MRYVIVGALAATLLAGCSGSSSSGTDLPTINGHPDGFALAQKIGCDTYADDEQTTMFAAHSSSCQMNNKTINIDVFVDSKAEKSYEAVVDSQGKDGTMIYGPLWAVQTDNADQAAQIQQTTGGVIH